MKKIFLSLLIVLGLSLSVSAQNDFRFRADGTFIIARISDVHWDENTTDDCARTISSITSVLERERPDLVVLNGDIVTAKPAREGWQSIIRLMEQSKVAFMVNMGNHDPEIATRAEIFSWLVTSKYYKGITAPDAEGKMDKILFPIYGHKDSSKVGGLIYCMDSGDYYPDQFVSHYDWIKFHQIAWYRSESQKYTELNGGTPIPSLMYFHIPTPEFTEVQNDSRTFKASPSREGVASSAVNSGIFSSVLEMKDVMCIISGHDHENDFIGQNRGVALAYGRVGGWSAYGDLERGARIVRMYEGQRKFDSWISTAKGRGGVYYYPSGINSIEEETMNYLPAFKSKAKQHGVAYTYYEGLFKKTADISSGKVLKQGTMSNISIKDAAVKDHFAYEFRALVNIPSRGVYQFYSYSDDGSVLMIDNQVVVDNDGGHSARRRVGKVALEAGLHELKVLYFEDYMGEVMEVGIASRALSEQPLPADWLFIP